MREKIALFCDLNSIASVTSYQHLFDIIETKKYSTCVAYNTCDFFVQGIWDLCMGSLDDELFFQIGDIGSLREIKHDRPYLDAVEKILSDIQPSTLYVIDTAAKISFTHVHGSRDAVENNLTEKGSTIFTI